MKQSLQFVVCIITICINTHIYTSFVCSSQTRALINSNKRRIQNDYSQLVDDLFSETIRFRLGYQKEQIHRIIHTRHQTSAMLTEENDNVKVFEDMMSQSGPCFLIFAIKLSHDSYDLSGECKNLARLLTKCYLGCCGCCV